jgi:hypothetical protein
MATKAELEALVANYEAVLRQIVEKAADYRAHYVRQHASKPGGNPFDAGFASGWEGAARLVKRGLPPKRT